MVTASIEGNFKGEVENSYRSAIQKQSLKSTLLNSKVSGLKERQVDESQTALSLKGDKAVEPKSGTIRKQPAFLGLNGDPATENSPRKRIDHHMSNLILVSNDLNNEYYTNHKAKDR